MSTPTLRSLIAEAEQVLEQQASMRTFADWQREAQALIAEACADPHRTSIAYRQLLELPDPDPAALPPRADAYREQTPAEIHTAVITGYEAGLDEVVDREIEAFRTAGTLPQSVAGLEALAKFLGVNP